MNNGSASMLQHELAIVDGGDWILGCVCVFEGSARELQQLQPFTGWVLIQRVCTDRRRFGAVGLGVFSQVCLMLFAVRGATVSGWTGRQMLANVERKGIADC